MGTTVRLGERAEGEGERDGGRPARGPTPSAPPSPAPAHATAMAAALNALAPTPVLWKVSDADLAPSTPLSSLRLGPHITPRPWLPQNALLQTGGVAVFVAHGGVNGVYEAAFHGVPLVGVPLFGDGGDNLAKAAHRGFGVTLGHAGLRDGGPGLAAAVRRVAGDPSFRAAASAASARLRARPRPARADAADVVESAVAAHAGVARARAELDVARAAAAVAAVVAPPHASTTRGDAL